MHHRLDRHDALGVGDFTNPAVLGERITHNEHLLVDRFIDGQELNLGNLLFFDTTDGRRDERAEHLCFGVGVGFHSNASALRRNVHHVPIQVVTSLLDSFGRCQLQRFIERDRF